MNRKPTTCDQERIELFLQHKLSADEQETFELHLDACHRDNVPILRRRGGCCSVVLDPGNLIVSVVAAGVPFGRHRECFDTLTDWLIKGLERSGISGVYQAGIG